MMLMRIITLEVNSGYAAKLPNRHILIQSLQSFSTTNAHLLQTLLLKVFSKPQ